MVYILTLVIGAAIVVSVLLQTGRAYGLTGNTMGGAESLFGHRRGLDDQLARVTTVLGILFLACVLLLGSGVLHS